MSSVHLSVCLYNVHTCKTVAPSRRDVEGRQERTTFAEYLKLEHKSSTKFNQIYLVIANSRISHQYPPVTHKVCLEVPIVSFIHKGLLFLCS